MKYLHGSGCGVLLHHQVTFDGGDDGDDRLDSAGSKNEENDTMNNITSDNSLMICIAIVCGL